MKTSVDLMIENVERLFPGHKEVCKGASVAVDGGRIQAIGPAQKIAGLFDGTRTLDGRGKLLTAGFVDSHTHLVFGGERSGEFVLRCAGGDYEQIASEGGGIRASVRMTRAATLQQLVDSARPRLQRMMAAGSTTIEIKSGYGLDLESELKMLRAIRQLSEEFPIEIVSTFMGAHEIPDEWRHDRAEYVRIICEQMIPQVAREGLAEFCDVFCERGVFDSQESIQILQAGQEHGLKPKVHADELAASGGSQVAAQVGAVSADHLMEVTAEGIEALKGAGVVPTLLPGTTFYLRKSGYAPARSLIDAGLEIAIATDRNPGSCTIESMLFIAGLSVMHLGLTPSEAIVAATRGGARALGREAQCGTIEEGKRADLILWDVPDEDVLIHEFANQVPHVVCAAGRIVFDSHTAITDRSDLTSDQGV
ncbi:MAG: imidazolonepropionase [Planctomycetota bacterium]|nr:imidazolonepropionase [Planctomycetota bacterium]